MKEPKLDNKLIRLYQNLAFLWKDHSFHLTYFASGYDGHPDRIMVGLESKTCKLLFEREDGTSLEGILCRVGTRSAWFSTPDYQYSALYGWYSFAGLLAWLDGGAYQDNNSKTELETLSHSLQQHIDVLLELLKEPKEVREKLAQTRHMHGHGHPDRVENIQNNRTTPHGGTQ